MRSLLPRRHWHARHMLAGHLAQTFALMCSMSVILPAAAAPVAQGLPLHTTAAGFQPAYLAARIGDKSHSQERANRDQQKNQTQKANQRSPKITPQQAAQRARSDFGGRVLNVILEHGPDGPYYRVKLLKQGRVRVVNIDARH